jgi:hypothetical protein
MSIEHEMNALEKAFQRGVIDDKEYDRQMDALMRDQKRKPFDGAKVAYEDGQDRLNELRRKIARETDQG